MNYRHLCTTASVAIATAGLAISSPAFAQSVYRLDLPRQPLDVSLRQLGSATGINIAFQPGVVGHQLAVPVKGRLSADDALARLLDGTSLAAQRTPGGSFVIVPRAPAPVQSAPPTLRRPVSMLVSEAAPVAAAPGASSPEASPPAEPASQAAAVGAGDIVVTGSRIQRSGFNTPTPVTAISSEILTKAAPSNLPDALNQLPQFVNSQSPASRQRVTINSGVMVGNFLNLRGLGAQRTLILLDGVRVPPTSADGSVSIDTLPQSLVQRVDVVTGGASSVYGSDAVVGVVNFVLNNSFTGLSLTGQSGVSNYGDAQSYKIGATGGVSMLDDRLRIIGSVERYSSGEIGRFDDRPLARNGLDYCTVGVGTQASPYMLLPGCRSQIATNGGLIRSGVLAGQQFQPDGSLVPFRPGGVGGVGGDGSSGLSTSQILMAPLKTWQVFGRISYEISPAVSAYVQGSWSEAVNGPYAHGSTTFTAGGPQGLIIQRDNAFLRPSIQALLPVGSTFTLGKWVDPEVARALGKSDLPLPVTKQVSRSKMASAGLKGRLGGSWKWDANFVHGETSFQSSTHEVNMLRMFAAVDAVQDPSGNIVCRVSLTNPGLYPGCVAYNPFGTGAASAAAIDYVYADSKWSVRNRMDSGSLNLSGDLFNTWAGPVAVAVGGEYRKQSLLQKSNADPSLPIDTTGLRGLPGAPVRFNTVNVGSARGSVKIKEIYGEINVPLARDIPFLRSLDLSGAARYTDYSTSGGVATWKLGADYRPFEDLRLRITRSRDIRAPSLFDLFANAQQAPRVLTDTHTGLQQPTLLVTRGNRGLKPEIANTLTYGAVYQPGWLPGFGLSIDAYDIRIRKALSTVDPQIILQSCEDSGGTGEICSFITRPNPFSDRSAANFPTAIAQVPINVATLRQRGIDFELNYGFMADRIFSSLDGKIQLHGLLSHIYDFRTDLGLNQPIQQSAGYRTIPKWRGSFSVAYDSEKFGIFVQERFTGSYDMALYKNVATRFFSDHGRAPNIGYTDLTLTVRPLPQNRKAELYLTVNNLFNVQAPLLFPAGNNSVNLYYPTIRTSYDIMGRYFTAGFRVKF